MSTQNQFQPSPAEIARRYANTRKAMAAAGLHALILRDVAEDIGMHESTVSRVTTSKYVHTPQGIFELKFFFNSGISRTNGEDLASQAGAWYVYQAVFDTSDHIRRRIRRYHDHGIAVEGTVLLGLDGHTEDGIKRLVDFLMEVELDLGFRLGDSSYAGDSLPEAMSEEDLSRRVDLEREAAKERILDLDLAVEKLFDLTPRELITEMEYRRLREAVEVCEKHLDGVFTDLFRAGLGAEAVRDLLAAIDLDELQHELRKESDDGHGWGRAPDGRLPGSGAGDGGRLLRPASVSRRCLRVRQRLRHAAHRVHPAGALRRRPVDHGLARVS